MPINARFTDVPVTFIADSYGELYKYFYSWMTKVFDFNGSDGQNFSSAPSYLVEYKENYVTDIYVVVYNNSGMPTHTFVMYDAYPNAINEVPLSWGDQNSLMKITVNFTFKEWAIEAFSSSQVGFFQSLIQGNINTFGSTGERLIYSTTRR
jgi:hypothetical protein